MAESTFGQGEQTTFPPLDDVQAWTNSLGDFTGSTHLSHVVYLKNAFLAASVSLDPDHAPVVNTVASILSSSYSTEEGQTDPAISNLLCAQQCLAYSVLQPLGMQPTANLMRSSEHVRSAFRSVIERQVTHLPRPQQAIFEDVRMHVLNIIANPSRVPAHQDALIDPDGGTTLLKSVALFLGRDISTVNPLVQTRAKASKALASDCLAWLSSNPSLHPYLLQAVGESAAANLFHEIVAKASSEIDTPKGWPIFDSEISRYHVLLLFKTLLSNRDIKQRVADLVAQPQLLYDISAFLMEPYPEGVEVYDEIIRYRESSRHLALDIIDLLASDANICFRLTGQQKDTHLREALSYLAQRTVAIEDPLYLNFEYLRSVKDLNARAKKIQNKLPELV